MSSWGQNFVIVFSKLQMAVEELLFLNLAISNKNKVPFKYFLWFGPIKKYDGINHLKMVSHMHFVTNFYFQKSDNFEIFILKNIFLNLPTFKLCFKKKSTFNSSGWFLGPDKILLFQVHFETNFCHLKFLSHIVLGFDNEMRSSHGVKDRHCKPLI